MSAEIHIADLEKRYETPAGDVLAVADVTLDVAAGEFVAVVGASGCGKSTLLRILAGFEEPSGGVVTVGGAPIAGPGPDRGVVFQDYGLFPWLTVHENVAYGPARRGLSRAAARAKADQYLETVGLTRFAKRFPGELSGGMQQRVAIARVLANDPAVMLMDEPFGALDALTRGDLQVQLRNLQRAEGRTVVFITHSIEEAVYLADRVVVMTGGASHGVPGHIREIVPIPLGQDRDVTTPEFNALKREISALVHERAAAPVD
jgi:NitT/TauT family transport system ATP-binding protein